MHSSFKLTFKSVFGKKGKNLYSNFWNFLPKDFTICWCLILEIANFLTASPHLLLFFWAPFCLFLAAPEKKSLKIFRLLECHDKSELYFYRMIAYSWLQRLGLSKITRFPWNCMWRVNRHVFHLLCFLSFLTFLHSSFVDQRNWVFMPGIVGTPEKREKLNLHNIYDKAALIKQRLQFIGSPVHCVLWSLSF